MTRSTTAGRHSIHNHFIVKSLALTRPGGLVVVLTSRYTLDAGNPAARREMAELADLSARSACRPARTAAPPAPTRSPTCSCSAAERTAHSRSQRPGSTRRRVAVGGRRGADQRALHRAPQPMLGQLDLAHGMYSAETLKVSGDLDATASRTGDRRPRPPDRARRPGDHARHALRRARRDTSQRSPRRRACGTGTSSPARTGASLRSRTVLQEPASVPRTAGGELRLLLDLRDSARALLTAEAHTLEDTPSLEQLRARLRESYNTYYARYGAINRFALQRTGRTDPETGEEIMRARRAAGDHRAAGRPVRAAGDEP